MAHAQNKKAQLNGNLALLAQDVIKRPDDLESIRQFVIASRQHNFHESSPDLEKAVIIAMRSPHVPAQMLVKPWYDLLAASSDFSRILDLAEIEDYKMFANKLQHLAQEQNLAAPLFLAGLEQLTIPALVPERFFTYLRRSLWDDEMQQLLGEDGFTAFAAAMACYCFHTGYIFQTAEDEETNVSALGQNLETAKGVALYACYDFLHMHAKAQEIYDGYKNVPALSFALSELLRTQLEEQEIATSIESLTKIEDKTSKDVQQQYIEFPYPRWQGTNPNTKIENCLLPIRNEKLDILVAGCGTGSEAMRIKTIFPNAHILAVDLSPASLAYAIRKTRELGITGIEFKQADILALPDALDKKFDVISSSGVIHHMEKPEDGFKALDSLLKPGGLICLGLYSSIGRQHIIKAHDIIAEQGYGNTAPEMRRFRKDCVSILPPETLNGLLRSRDFFILPQFRDLLFHVMEHPFDLLQIDKMLDEHGYKFEEFLLPDVVLQKYKSRFPGDTEAKSLRNWNLFEKAHPQTFEAMYRFVCRKSVTT